jgi:NTE family protein
MATSASPRTAFVLAGGGSLGAAQVGMLAELVAAGERPDLVVGVSAGAINAAFFAAEPTARTIAKMEHLWQAITTRRALGLSWRSLLGVVGLRDHVASPAGLRSLLVQELSYREFAEAAVPLHVVCADLVTGAEIVLSGGPVVEAVLASAAIPGVFPPVSIDDRLLVDGAVAANTPIATAIRLGATRLLVLPAGFACALRHVSRHAFARAMHAITLLGARQLLQDYERYSPSVEIHIVPPLCPVTHSSYDYAHGTELIRRGRDSTRAWLGGGGLSRTDFPGPLAVHTH